MNADEVRADYISRLGDERGEFIYALRNELVWLHAKWQQYRILFGTSDKRIDLLNEMAPFVVRVIQDSLWEDVVMHLARLADRPGQGSRARFTIRRLPGLFPEVP